MKTATLLLLLLLAQLWLPACAADEPEVTVTVIHEGDAYTVDALMHVPITPQEAWAVLADFNHFADFVPNTQFSHIVSKPGEPLRIEQKGQARYGPLSYSFESLREVELRPYETLKSRLIKGSMKKMETLTRLSAETGGTSISYHNETVPDSWLPPLIGTEFIRHEVAEQFRALIQEMLRRKGKAVK